MAKRKKVPVTEETCGHCLENRRYYRRITVKETTGHFAREKLLFAEIEALTKDLNDAAWMLTEFDMRIQQYAPEARTYIINPADRTRIERYEADRQARYKKQRENSWLGNTTPRQD